MVIRLPNKPFRNMSETHWFHLASDIHVGSCNLDLRKLRGELDEAKKRKARIFINGDLFDAIHPKDSKRFVPSKVCPELRGKDNVFNAALDMATRILTPYADFIDVVGCGNHESAATKFHGVDLTSLLIERLQTRTKHKIHHGGYTGAIIQPFRHDKSGGCDFVIYYHHGTASSAPVTKGLISFNRMAASIQGANVLWQGHLHQRYVVPNNVRRVSCVANSVRKEPLWYVMTGSYAPEEDGSQFDEDGNYQTDWARERMVTPEGTGGILLGVQIGTHQQTRVVAEVAA